MGSPAVILLDTHVLVWAVADPSRLSRTAIQTIRDAQQSEGLAISAITFWELAVLLARRRIELYGTIENSLKRFTDQIAVRPITLEVAAAACQFPPHYSRDPADRIIGATAQLENMPLVTKDQNLRDSGLLHTIW
jgi:PIN domain nuclease of toxin-antitoxin system